MKIGIVGLGLMGGSMAKCIKSRTLHTVYGADLSEETMLLARMCGAIDGHLDDKSLPECDLVLLGLRPGDAVNWAQSHGAHLNPKAVLIDLCGVKRAVVPALTRVAKENGFVYVGGHPMAGKERGGFVNSSEDLYAGAHMILTPAEEVPAAVLEWLKTFFVDLGFAGLTLTDPREHDRIISFTSQLAHVVSSAYVRSPEAARRRGFSAGSFRDMTRVARLDEDMWTELMMDNADFLTQELDILVAHLTEYNEALKHNDAAALHALLKDGREKKAAAGEN